MYKINHAGICFGCEDKIIIQCLLFVRFIHILEIMKIHKYLYYEVIIIHVMICCFFVMENMLMNMH